MKIIKPNHKTDHITFYADDENQPTKFYTGKISGWNALGLSVWTPIQGASHFEMEIVISRSYSNCIIFTEIGTEARYKMLPSMIVEFIRSVQIGDIKVTDQGTYRGVFTLRKIGTSICLKPSDPSEL